MDDDTAAAHDRKATGLQQLYGEHRAALRRFLIARTGSAADADDVLQEVWLRLRAGGGPIADGRAYLFSIAHNLVLDRVREEGRRRRREQDWGGAADMAAADLPDGEAALMRRQEVERLERAIAALPPGAGRAFRLHKLEGLSHVETAARLGISRKGVEKHMAVAWSHLRRLLHGEELG